MPVRAGRIARHDNSAIRLELATDFPLKFPYSREKQRDVANLWRQCAGQEIVARVKERSARMLLSFDTLASVFLAVMAYRVIRRAIVWDLTSEERLREERDSGLAH